jgi:hypothetical protein
MANYDRRVCDRFVEKTKGLSDREFVWLWAESMGMDLGRPPISELASNLSLEFQDMGLWHKQGVAYIMVLRLHGIGVAVAENLTDRARKEEPL